MNSTQRKQVQQAQVLLQHGNLEAAETIYRTLVQEGIRNHAIFCDLAAIHGMRGQHQEMIDFYRHALAINPNLPEALSNIACILREQGDVQGAIDHCHRALAINPKSPETLVNLGNALRDEGEVTAAIDAYRQALTIQPTHPKALNNLGNALRDKGDIAAAIDAFRRSLAIDPDFPDALSNLGSALRHQGDLQGAVDACRRALAIQPDFPDALTNLGVALRAQGDLQGATACYQQAIAINGSHAEAHWDLSLALLQSGDYENGWKEYDWRFQVKTLSKPHAHPGLEQWTGGNLAPGEPLIIVSEQGLGDTLQFMRYVAHLDNAGLPVAFCAQTKLHGLIRASGITKSIYSPEETNQLTVGKWLPLLSLPRHLNIRPEHPLVEPPYIKVPQQQVAEWQQKLAAEPRPIVGVHWQGQLEAEEGTQRGRSLPLASFSPVIEQTGARLLSLQKGFGAEQLAGCPFRKRFVGCQEEISTTWDFVATAAIVANCDLVITSDSAVAHLAGGMGRPTWLLLAKVPDWRWDLTGDTTFWYPSMRLFHQRERGDWHDVMDRVAAALNGATPN